LKKILTAILTTVFAISLISTVLANPGNGKNQGFITGIVVPVDGEDYYLAGAPIPPLYDVAGPTDVPGHYWVLVGKNQLVGKHYNTGPFGLANGWSSDAPDGALLYKVHGIIDTWTAEKAERYASRGYVHYHELEKVSDGSLHPTKVLWLKHTARTTFALDGGPYIWGGGSPPAPYAHQVSPGVDYEFPNNYNAPYP
jgi:selenium-binding protein 1